MVVVVVPICFFMKLMLDRGEIYINMHYIQA